MLTYSSDDGCTDRPDDRPPGHGTGPALSPGPAMEKAYTFFLELRAHDPTRSKVQTPQLALQPKDFLQLHQLCKDHPGFASVRSKTRYSYRLGDGPPLRGPDALPVA